MACSDKVFPALLTAEKTYRVDAFTRPSGKYYYEGYRNGLLRAFALLTDQTIDEATAHINAVLLAELPAARQDTS